MKKQLFVVLAVAMCLFGCKEKDNPTLNVEDIQTFAFVSGTVLYEHPIGVNIDSTQVLLDTLPLALQAVEVQVDASQYSANAWGVTYTFSGEIDKDGHYLIQIPVLANSAGLTLNSIALRPFYMMKFPVVITRYVSTGWTFITKYDLVDKQVYHDGTMGMTTLPTQVFAEHEYFCGNEIISNYAFQQVGL